MPEKDKPWSDPGLPKEYAELDRDIAAEKKRTSIGAEMQKAAAIYIEACSVAAAWDFDPPTSAGMFHANVSGVLHAFLSQRYIGQLERIADSLDYMRSVVAAEGVDDKLMEIVGDAVLTYRKGGTAEAALQLMIQRLELVTPETFGAKGECEH